MLHNQLQDAGWSSLVARQAHNLKAAGSNPAPATNFPRFSRDASEKQLPRSSAQANYGPFIDANDPE